MTLPRGKPRELTKNKDYCETCQEDTRVEIVYEGKTLSKKICWRCGFRFGPVAQQAALPGRGTMQLNRLLGVQA